MRKRIRIDVSTTDRQALTAIVMDRDSPQKHVWRAQIVLLTAEGCGTMEVTRRPLVALPSRQQCHCCARF
jgi:hypothetical protein